MKISVAVTRPRPYAACFMRMKPKAGDKCWSGALSARTKLTLIFPIQIYCCEFIRLLRFYIDKGRAHFSARCGRVFVEADPARIACILQETHEIVKLMRTLIDHLDDNIWLITETNVPAHENLEYFGNSNEVHLIYNFALPPLAGACAVDRALDSYLRRWMMSHRAHA